VTLARRGLRVTVIRWRPQVNVRFSNGGNTVGLTLILGVVSSELLFFCASQTVTAALWHPWPFLLLLLLLLDVQPCLLFGKRQIIIYGLLLTGESRECRRCRLWKIVLLKIFYPMNNYPSSQHSCTDYSTPGCAACSSPLHWCWVGSVLAPSIVDATPPPFHNLPSPR